LTLRSIAAALQSEYGAALSRGRMLEGGASRSLIMTGTESQVRASAPDARARVRAEEALAQQRRWYEAILTNTADLAYVFDLSHRFIYANEGLLKMWGKSWDEVIGKTCLQLGYEPLQAAMQDAEIERVVATKQPVHGEAPLSGTLGRRDYDYLLVPVLDTNGEVEAVAGTMRDVTERKQLEASLREADRRKDEFLATLAHELRNPLAPIRNAVHLLKATNASELQARAARDIIDRQVQHMVRLVDDLMDVSRITLGQVSFRYERASLTELLTDALEAARPAIEAGGQQLVVELPKQELQIEGDVTRLSQVFQNLLNNASKYTPNGGQITLRAEQRGREIVVSVRDTGIGIPKDWQPRVFDLFTRVHPSDPIKSSGLGIGLALAKQLVELHNGHIEVNSEGTGAGSEFLVYLPVLVATAQPAHPARSLQEADTSAGKRRVLVVDDNRDSAKSLAMLLELSGYTVALAFGGPEALQVFETFGADTVLLDIGMPVMDGYEVARRLRSSPLGRDILLVALTGWGQLEDKRRAASAGFDDHLTKPIDPALLATLLRAPQVRAGLRPGP